MVAYIAFIEVTHPQLINSEYSLLVLTPSRRLFPFPFLLFPFSVPPVQSSPLSLLDPALQGSPEQPPAGWEPVPSCPRAVCFSREVICQWPPVLLMFLLPQSLLARWLPWGQHG